MNQTIPHLRWFSDHFALPLDREPAIATLLASEENGDTAIPLDASSLDWGNALVPVVPSDPIPNTPLPLVQVSVSPDKTYLQSWRFYRAEKEIATAILARMRENENASTPPNTDPLLEKLFASSDPQQKSAAQAAATLSLAILTGGPGTGKTYTLARALVLMLENGEAPDAIRLTAPTGKATDRMKEAIGQSLSTLPSTLLEKHGAALRQIADNAKTLHSLLQYNPGTGKSPYNEDAPLPWHTIIVDESSMVNTLLWQKLFQVVRPSCRLILIGDPNQLESVEQGAVLKSLTCGARTPETHPVPVFRKAWIHLTASHRFKDCPRIQNLATALIDNSPDLAESILRDSQNKGTQAASDLAWLPSAEASFAQLPEKIQQSLATIANAERPEDALAAMRSVCILTAQRAHFVGALAFGEKLDNHFRALARQSGKPHNQPIIINRNDPETGLRNGSVGILHTQSNGERKAYFPASDGQSLKTFPLAQLPPHQLAWALTIHRAQGSEYTDVLVVLPVETSPLVSRSLIYTAITRAKKSVFVAGSLETVRKAISEPSERTTLLSAFLHSRLSADF